MADKNPAMLNDTSVALAIMTPAMMGTKDAHIASDGIFPRKMALKPTLNTGSNALTVCVKLTATFPSDTFVSAFPSMCTIPNVAIGFSIDVFTSGLALAPSPQDAATSALPIASSKKVAVSGIGTAFSSAFWYTLNAIEK